MFETCDWNDDDEEEEEEEDDAAAGDQVTSDREKISGARRTDTSSRKNRLKRNRQLLDVLRSLNTPSTLHPDLPPPPEATPPKKRKKKHTTDVIPSDTSPPEDSPTVERPLESAERLSRQQWRNKLKNKRKNRNKFKVVTGTSGGAEDKGARATRGGAGENGAGATRGGAGHSGAGATAAAEEIPQNLRKGKQNGNIKETPTPPGPRDCSSQQVTPRERAKLQKLKKMMKGEAGWKKTETPREEEDPHNIEQSEADNSEGGRDRSAELRSRMEQKLNSARFRYINQQLYTSSSQEARQLFLQDPQAFSLYHSGFSQQVQRWPINPITEIIKYIKNRPSSLVVADFGCGDALLARSVRNKVHSFDLVALNDHVTVCDIAEVPLQDSSVDVAVFCLSLMGTNLSDFLQEAHRVLKPGGVLLVAEVSSRFDDVRQFLSAMSQLGFKAVNKNTENSHFFLFEFSKTGRARDATKHPGLQLNPCLYKKR